MLVKILKHPPKTMLGVPLGHFRVGEIYDIREPLAAALLTDAFAEAVSDTADELILVVDDDAGVRNLARNLLAEHGFNVVVAADGEEALESLQQRRPDLILLDLHMPVMDGWQFRQHQQDLPDRICAAARVVLLSGRDDALVQATLLGAVGVIRKPFDAADLLNAILGAIGPRNPSLHHA